MCVCVCVCVCVCGVPAYMYMGTYIRTYIHEARYSTCIHAHKFTCYILHTKYILYCR